jgi:hypothetical protein
LPFTLTFFIQIFEPRNSPQTILVHFPLEQSLVSRQPKSQLRPHPFRAFPGAPYYISLATKLSFPQSPVCRPCVGDLTLGFSPWPIPWKTWWDQPSDSGSHASLTTTREPHSSPPTLEPVLAHPDHPPASWASWS